MADSQLMKKWKKYQEMQSKIHGKIEQSPQRLSSKIEIAVDNKIGKIMDWINNFVEELCALAKRIGDLETIVSNEMDESMKEE